MIQRVVEPSRIRRGRMATSPAWYVERPTYRIKFSTKRAAEAYEEKGCENVALHNTGRGYCMKCGGSIQRADGGDVSGDAMEGGTVITTVKEALAAGMEIVAVHGAEVRIGATEYRHQPTVFGEYVTFSFGIHLGDDCELVQVRGCGDATWDDAVAKLRETHVEVVASMRREAAMKALQAAEPKGPR